MNMLHIPQEVARDLLSYCIDNTDHETWTISDILISGVNETKFSIPTMSYCLFRCPIAVDIIVDVKNNQIILQVYNEDKILSVLRLQDDCYQHYYNHLLEIFDGYKEQFSNTFPFRSLVQAEQESICHLLYRLSDQPADKWKFTLNNDAYYDINEDISVTLINRNEVEIVYNGFKVSVKTEDLPELHYTTIHCLWDVAHKEINCENTTDIIQLTKKSNQEFIMNTHFNKLSKTTQESLLHFLEGALSKDINTKKLNETTEYPSYEINFYNGLMITISKYDYHVTITFSHPDFTVTFTSTDIKKLIWIGRSSSYFDVLEKLYDHIHGTKNVEDTILKVIGELE